MLLSFSLIAANKVTILQLNKIHNVWLKTKLSYDLKVSERDFGATKHDKKAE